MKNNKGFTIIEGLLILVIVGLIGGTSYYVWHSNKATEKTLNSAQSENATSAQAKKSSPKSSTPTTPDPTADWTSYSSAKGEYSLKYPAAWAQALNPDFCSDGLLLLGGDSKSVGKCGADGVGAFGQMAISQTAGDQSSSEVLSSGYIDVAKQSVTLNGVVGAKVSGTASGQESSSGEGGFRDGTKITEYIFYTNGKTYNATYVQGYSYPDVLSDFDLMITKTLEFSS